MNKTPLTRKDIEDRIKHKKNDRKNVFTKKEIKYLLSLSADDWVTKYDDPKLVLANRFRISLAVPARKLTIAPDKE